MRRAMIVDPLEQIATEMGVTVAHAREIVAKVPGLADRIAEVRAAGKAAMTVAEVRELADLNDVDLADIAESAEPEAMLREITMTRAERRVRASIAAHESWAQTEDPSERTRPAREAFERRFELQVDPEGRLDPADRARRAEHARKAYFQRLALKSARARRLKAEGA